MSSMVDRNEVFEKSMVDWWDLAVFITAFCDVSLTMDVHEAISTTAMV